MELTLPLCYLPVTSLMNIHTLHRKLENTVGIKLSAMITSSGIILVVTTVFMSLQWCWIVAVTCFKYGGSLWRIIIWEKSLTYKSRFSPVSHFNDRGCHQGPQEMAGY